MMQEPIWVRDDVVLAIHHRQIAEHGGLEGVRDKALLESALSRSRNLYTYSDPLPTFSAIAAAYTYDIAKNHPFLDGNKRTAFVVCMLFLQLNGISLHASEEEKYHIFLELAQGTLSEADLAGWIGQKALA
jgi:death on curing protein